MRSIGNTKANSIYNPDESRHPPPTNTSEFNDRDGELEKFIRRKWVEGRFKAGASGPSRREGEDYGRRGGEMRVRANTTGTSSVGSGGINRASPNPELNDIVVPRTDTRYEPSSSNPPPIFARASSSTVASSPARPRPRPTHSATLEIPVISSSEASRYSVDSTPSGGGLGQGGRGATRSMVEDSWSDLMAASSSTSNPVEQVAERRSPNPFARKSSPQPPVQAGSSNRAQQQPAGNGAYGDLLGLNSNVNSAMAISPTPSAQGAQQPPSYPTPNGYANGGSGPQPFMHPAQQYNQQAQFQQQPQYGQPQQLSYPHQMQAMMMGSPNGLGGYQNGGMGMTSGYSQNSSSNGMMSQNGQMPMASNTMYNNAGYGQTTSPFPLAATSPYSNLSNPSAGYFGQQQPQPTPQQSQGGYGGMMANGYGSPPNGMMQMGMNGQGNNGMMLPPGWGGGR